MSYDRYMTDKYPVQTFWGFQMSASAADSDVLLQLSPQPQLLTVQLAGGSSESPAIGLVVARAGHRLGLSAAQLGRRIILHPRRRASPRVNQRRRVRVLLESSASVPCPAEIPRAT